MNRTYQITLACVVFAGITAFVFAAAVNSQANLLFFAFGLMVGAIFVSGLFSTLMLGKIDIERDIADHAEVGQRVEVRYRLTSRKRFWPCLALHISEQAPKGSFVDAPRGYCLHLSRRQALSVGAHLVPARRGKLQLQRIRLACSFPFGLIRRIVHVHRPMTLVVYPRVGVLHRELILGCRDAAAGGAVDSQARGGNDEFFGLREYRAGDNVKAIHWRRTARTGQMVVREMTRASPPQMVVAVDVRAWRQVPDGSAKAEQALELASTLVCHGILQNYAVGLVIAGTSVHFAQPRTGRETRDFFLRAIATLDLAVLSMDAGPAGGPKSMAHWALVTLRAADTGHDILPPGASCTRLPLDDPQASQWMTMPPAAAQANAQR